MAPDPVRSLHASNGLSIRVLPSGCLSAIERGETLINQIVASPVAGGVQRIYLRARAGGEILSTEIVGPAAASSFIASSDRFDWSGSWRGLEYRCNLRLHPGGAAWFWQVEVRNESGAPVRCDAILVQDVGLASRGQVRNNELFTSQYLDHFATRHAEVGHLVMTRQNLPQGVDAHPWLMQGCFPAARGFTTDGFDFFGAEHRGDGMPRALARDVIGERVRQYETAYVAIQSSDAELAPARAHAWTFFAHFMTNHPAPSSDADAGRLERVRAMRDELAAAPGESVATRPDRAVFNACALLRGDDLDPSEVENLWPGPRRHEDGGSFFHGDDAAHVVMKSKELAVARPHGHVLRAGRGLMPDDEVMSTTCYAAGVLASQLALGNASLARLLSGARDPLNVVRSSGLRLFVRDDPRERWQLLGVPSAFGMSIDRCRWIYKRGGGELLTVTCAAARDEPRFSYDVRAEGQPVELLVCGEIAAGPAEYDSTPRLSYDAPRTRLTVRPAPDSLLATKQPELAFQIDSDVAIGGDENLFEDGASRGLPYFTIRTRPTNAMTFTISGSFGAREGRCSAEPWALPVVRIDRSPQVQDTLTWFARDALVHLGTPRGLEQPNGGAWGVRDVCQGPVEFLLSCDRTREVGDILRAVFAQQYARRGDWPQWFMFPPFQEIQSRHAHGDVVIWPLKALCDYLEHSNDRAILHERLPYTDDDTLARTERSESILEHCDRALRKMRDEFLPGVALPRYGDGDWDDSLQPADPLLRERMVSAWTAELMFQTLRRYAAAMAHVGERARAATAHEMAGDVERDFQRHLMPGGVVAGFAVFDGAPARPVEYLLHPSDARTGLRYRLIPMTRGILSGIFTREQANQHLELIREHLLFPDGARLMDRPTVYHGGLERTFRRSESAAFFGREIGLQYVHAHLRYAEAMAVMGRADELWRALLVVNPIAVTDVVKSARPRQRNCYFSSSDAAFMDRYEASRDYDKLRRGAVPVDAGWRIYSSGPGIYTSLVIRHLFGLRRHFDHVEFDPVLPKDLDGAAIEMRDGTRRVRYRLTAGGVKSVVVNGRPLPTEPGERNPFRPGGLRVSRVAFDGSLSGGENLVEVTW